MKKETKDEGQQIEEIARLFKKYFNDIFRHFDVMSLFVLDRLWLVSETNQNG